MQQHDIFDFHNFNLIAEFFLCVSITYLIFHGIIISLNKNYVLTQNSLIYICVLILFLSIVLIFNEFYLYDFEISNFKNTIKNDNLSFLIKILILIFSIICLLIIQQYLIDKKINNFEYLIFLLFSIVGLILLSCANDLITAYLAIELQSLAFYILASFKKNSNFSIDAGIKYFILGALSSNLFLFGSSFIYGLSGSTNFDDFYYLFSFLPHYNISNCNSVENNFDLFLNQLNYDNLIKLSLTFIFASLFFKLALSPFYIWVPDVYEGSPTSSTVFFSTVPKLGIFVLLIKIFYYCFYCIFDSWRYYLALIAVLSVIVGSFAGLEQRKLKSLLAYSSISHMGYSLIAFSTGIWVGVKMLLSYLIIYLCSNLTVWAIFIYTKLKENTLNKSNKDLTDLILLNKSNKHLAFCFMIMLFSIAGFPPMIGFLVKVNIFLSTIEISSYYVAFISILCSVISTFYYIRLIKIIYFEKELIGKLYNPIKNDAIHIAVIFLYLLIFLFINPSLLYLLTSKPSYAFYNILLLN